MAMEVLQRAAGYGVLANKSEFFSAPDFVFNDSSSSVRAARRGSLPVWSSAARQHVRIIESKGSMFAENERGKGRRDARSVTTRAALLRGLGGLLKQGYVLRNHGIVDENTAVETTGDVIEKLKNGFKNFKETEYKCVVWRGSFFPPLLNFRRLWITTRLKM